MNSGDFVMSPNTTMQYLEEVTSGNYNLVEGLLLSIGDCCNRHLQIKEGQIIEI